jgi:D-tyrosyl-tRNA(Tyr) deacylase
MHGSCCLPWASTECFWRDTVVPKVRPIRRGCWPAPAQRGGVGVRAVIQRVNEASVSIEGRRQSSIGRGLLVLLGVENGDTDEDIEWLAGKVARLRVFPDAQGVMNLAVGEVGGEVLVVSQFTLLASTRKGNRPSYSRAAPPEAARPLYERFVAALSQQLGTPVATGQFGAMMQVHLVNDGPVTILMDSRLRE